MIISRIFDREDSRGRSMPLANPLEISVQIKNLVNALAFTAIHLVYYELFMIEINHDVDPTDLLT